MSDGDFTILLERVRQGSEEAAWELFDQYNQPILRIVRRRLPNELRGKFDSTDFVQSTWASIFAHRSRMVRFDQPGQFVAYIGAIAANKIGMEIRRRMTGKKHPVQLERPLVTTEMPSNEPADRAPSASQIAVAREVLSQLLRKKSPMHQRMIELRAAGYTFADIAEQLGFDERSVRRVLDRASKEHRA